MFCLQMDSAMAAYKTLAVLAIIWQKNYFMRQIMIKSKPHSMIILKKIKIEHRSTVTIAQIQLFLHLKTDLTHF